MEFQPLKIEGVVTEEVGRPRNDGSPGSALYAVPIRLSRELAAQESDLLVQLWDRPPRFSTMHRPGIARVVGDRLILNGTTIDEVADYHVETLRLITDEFNRRMREVVRGRQGEVEADQKADEEHRRHVADVAERINFGE